MVSVAYMQSPSSPQTSPQIIPWQQGTGLPSNAAGFSDHHESKTCLSSQTYNLPPLFQTETAKFLNTQVLNIPLHLWKMSPRDHNLTYKMRHNETGLEEIRILQDVIFRIGIEECKQARETWPLLFKNWKGKENLD